MELWSTPFLTVTAFLFAFFAMAFRNLFSEARDIQANVDFAVGEAKRRTVQDVTDLMAEEAERAAQPAWDVNPSAFAKAMQATRERKARITTQEQWRIAMTCSCLVNRMKRLRSLESTGRVFCMIGLITLVAYVLSILFWLPQGSQLLWVVTGLMWSVPLAVVISIRAICEVVARRIDSTQREIEEPWRV